MYQSITCRSLPNNPNQTDDNLQPIKKQVSSSKISKIYSNIIAETLYSSDSDCEYEIIQTIVKVDQTKSKIQCEICGKKFRLKKSLDRHCTKHENARVLPQSLNNTTIIGETIQKNPNLINQNQMSLLDTMDRLNEAQLGTEKRIQSESERLNSDFELQFLESHLTGVTQGLNTVETEATDFNIIQNEAGKSNLKDTKRSLKCSQCSRVFRLASSLTNHLKMHIKQSVAAKQSKNCPISKRLSCNFCPKIFSNEINFKNHVASYHGDGGKFQEEPSNERVNEDFNSCSVCSRCFASEKLLDNHVKKHNVVKPHLCNVCGKVFATKRYLTFHLRTHTKEKMHECIYCAKKFVQKGNLSEHLRTHTGKKPFTCAQCQKSFTHYSGLTQHLQTHTDNKKFVCSACGKSFKFAGHFKEHMRTHSGIKPYKCKVCQRAFSNSSTLNVHQRTHSGDRPFKCSSCNRGFIKNYGLQQHYKTHPTHLQG